MPARSDIFTALSREKALGASDVARGLGISRQHAHRLLRGEREPGARFDELERLLALGEDGDDGPQYAVAMLGPAGVELLTTGATQPLFEQRENAERVAELIDDAVVVPVWRSYAWRRLVQAYAVWGTEPEERNLFIADAEDDLPFEAIFDELTEGLRATAELLGAKEPSLH